ncbi:hypothetical protein KOW79_000177 [Hemibagrus wyckioides]|uniref:Uncharacterized protein n=1 Tax=Hemibagrus wyckioides TaxID=337641 RepID=A0A9D3P7L3_9TELE|nr:hypothetical protein KOW79_000177 [Hemibagrus wyckioides]
MTERNGSQASSSLRWLSNGEYAEIARRPGRKRVGRGECSSNGFVFKESQFRAASSFRDSPGEERGLVLVSSYPAN